MSKPKAYANRKRGKQQKQEAAPKLERAKVEALGAEGKCVPEIRKQLGISPSA